VSTDQSGSTVPRRQLGRKLREARESRQMTVAQAIAALEWSKPRLWRYETGQVPIHPNDVDAMCRLYGVPTDVTEGLKALARETKAKGWWHTYSEIPEWFELYLGMEAVAGHIRHYEAEIIPGLLQSPAYTRAIIGQSLAVPTAEQLEKQASVRMQRQKLLTRTQPPAPRVDIVLSEAALLRGFDRATMFDQLTKLLALIERPNISIRVVPLSAGPHKAFRGPFVILDFPRESPARDPEPTTIYVEQPTGALYLDKLPEVAAYGAIWADLADRVAVDEAESRRLIEDRAKEWSHA